METMICRICQQPQPPENFHVRESGRRRSECKRCVSARLHASYLKNIEGRRAYSHERNKMNEVREWHLERNRRVRQAPVNQARERRHAAAYRSKYPEKEAAKREVRRAIERGTLERPTSCPKCSSPDKKSTTGRHTIHAHHDDYSKPLDVIWLCVRCHANEHRPPARAVLASLLGIKNG